MIIYNQKKYLFLLLINLIIYNQKKYLFLLLINLIIYNNLNKLDMEQQNTEKIYAIRNQLLKEHGQRYFLATSKNVRESRDCRNIRTHYFIWFKNLIKEDQNAYINGGDCILEFNPPSPQFFMTFQL